MSNITTRSRHAKKCPDCGATSLTAEFYKTSCYCKPCHLLRGRKNQAIRQAKSADRREETSTNVGRAVLSQRGIPCVAGSSIGAAWVDLVAWACVPIEVKMCHVNEGKLRWTFTPEQQKRGFRGLFLLLAVDGEDAQSWVVPCDGAWFLDDSGKPNVTAVTATIGSTHTNAKNEDYLKQYRDRFDHIDRYRRRYSSKLSGTSGGAVIEALRGIVTAEPDLSLDKLPLFALLEKAG